MKFNQFSEIVYRFVAEGKLQCHSAKASYFSNCKEDNIRFISYHVVGTAECCAVPLTSKDYHPYKDYDNDLRSAKTSMHLLKYNIMEEDLHKVVADAYKEAIELYNESDRTYKNAINILVSRHATFKSVADIADEAELIKCIDNMNSSLAKLTEMITGFLLEKEIENL